MTIGIIGQLLILISFVACVLSGISYFQSTRDVGAATSWRNIGRWAWFTMLTCTIVASGLLIYLIATHQFQYSYPFRYSSNNLPMKYLFSSFWAGQEGSFLLWIVFTGIVGAILIRTAKGYEPYVLSVIAICEAFLISMVVGLKLGTVSIGANPFATIAEAFPNAPVLQTPGFVPRDGQGLNDLLQNYWMVIHPPTLFIGFTLLIVPFAYAIAGLWRREFTQWVKPALPWAIIANLILIIGITMGGYWAYITLSFGGYWAWDPVENSSLVPWLVGVAGIHTMISQKKSASSQKAAVFLNIFAFMLVIYSTFLTRSGILGETSVHSFVDLGLYGQLVVWIAVMGLLGFGLMAYRYKELPKTTTETEVLSRQFMIFSGAMVLCAIAAVIILGTSAPIAGKIFRNKPSAVPIEFYDNWTLPLAIVLALLAGLGQLFWWNKMSLEKLNSVLVKPLGAALGCTALVLIFTPFTEGTIRPPMETVAAMSQAGFTSGIENWWHQYGMSLLLVFLIFTAFFALFGNGTVLWRIGKGNFKLVGGAVSHIGLVMMLFGIITSATFNNPLVGDANNSVPQEGSKERKNFVVSNGQTVQVENYKVKYVKSEPTEDGHTAYQLDFADNKGHTFTVKPVAYQNKRQQWILHPDLKSYFEKDIYVAVSPAASVMEQPQTPANANGGELKLRMGDSRIIGKGKFDVKFKQFDLNVDKKLVPANAQIAVSSVVEVRNTETKETRVVKPIYVILNDGKNTQEFIQNRIPDWGLAITFGGMDISKDGRDGQIKLFIEGAEVKSADDWVVVQAYEKPFINILWFGAILMFCGFGISFFRRKDDVSK